MQATQFSLLHRGRILSNVFVHYTIYCHIGSTDNHIGSTDNHFRIHGKPNPLAPNPVSTVILNLYQTLTKYKLS
jgi:hypothetical protein